ncbi:MAG: hypothetical protein JXA42_09355 [Anaerolineales bacterium]|nr:hypothetical protein [Anaerolineales bacterium]
MEQANFQVLEFSDSNLCLALSNEYCPPEEVAKLARTEYLLGYLRHEDIQAQTIVIENEYIDRYYLEDFSSYYVRCFRRYDCRCKRIHFFAQVFSDKEFVDVVLGIEPSEKNKVLIESYRGFIVARPLPNAVIGRTILTTYAPDNGRRYYPCVKTCSANLFGIDLSVESLEYQEQDTVLAACATVALWSCFHKTNELFQTPIPSPAAITRVATEIVHISRPFPSHGLIVNQIHNAILRNNLVAEIFDYRIQKQKTLIPLLYGYIKFGLPVLLGINIEGQGLHAITLNGYSLRRESALPNPDADNAFIPFTASRIDKFYAHDDQIGPFSRIWIKQVPDDKTQVIFDGTWKDEFDQFCVLKPYVVIIPLYHKIRVTFIDVQKWLTRLNWVLLHFCGFTEASSLEWDLYLTTTNDLKQDLKQRYRPADPDISRILFSQHPRFIWRAILKSGKEHLLELFFDATDMERSFPIYEMIVPYRKLDNYLKQLINDKTIQYLVEDILTLPFFRFIKNK